MDWNGLLNLCQQKTNLKIGLRVMPLSNWLSGYDRYRHEWEKVSHKGLKFPHELHWMVMEEGQETVLDLIIQKADRLRLKNKENHLAWVMTVLEEGMPNTGEGTTGIGWVMPLKKVKVFSMGLYKEGDWQPMLQEHMHAVAFEDKRGSGGKLWEAAHPRSFSILPVALACQARCAFCFSKASASSVTEQKTMEISEVKYWGQRAKELGAYRAVITGGGEPSLCSKDHLVNLIEALKDTGFSSILMISNGLWVDKGSEEDVRQLMGRWKQAGLTRLALSRHGVTAEEDAQIMGVKPLKRRPLEYAKEQGLEVRSICVLQKKGVNSLEKVKEYVKRCARERCSQICFKELYVSALSENPWAPSPENQYATMNQVPLMLAMKALEEMGLTIEARLPWGAPVYQGMVDGVKMEVACYTEPSCGWELDHGLVRSWNLMASGVCLASLEDPQSVLSQE